MKANTRLRELSFRDCSLFDEAVPALATIITQALQLQVLGMSISSWCGSSLRCDQQNEEEWGLSVIP